MPDVEISPDGKSSTFHYGATATGPSAAELVDRALERMSGELDPYDAARQLLTRWCEQDSTIATLLPNALIDLEAREKRQLKRRVKQQVSAVKVGDIALMASSMGPIFYRVRKVITDAAGKVTGLSLSDLGKDNTGQVVAIERITAVIADSLNAQE
jgi:hypothetical protein